MAKEVIHLRKWHAMKACDDKTTHGMDNLTSEENEVTCPKCKDWLLKVGSK